MSLDETGSRPKTGRSNLSKSPFHIATWPVGLIWGNTIHLGLIPPLIWNLKSGRQMQVQKPTWSCLMRIPLAVALVSSLAVYLRRLLRSYHDEWEDSCHRRLNIRQYLSVLMTLTWSSLANGFIAVWVIKRLLEKGFTVIGTIRSEAKGTYLKEKLFKSYFDEKKLELVVVDDITKVRVVIICRLFLRHWYAIMLPAWRLW